jgi:dihydrodipicolinate synthase/N-acetylneuraminate lyase
MSVNRMLGNRPVIHIAKVRCADYEDARALCDRLVSAGVDAIVCSPRSYVTEVHFTESIDNQTADIMAEFSAPVR